MAKKSLQLVACTHNREATHGVCEFENSDQYHGGLDLKKGVMHGFGKYTAAAGGGYHVGNWKHGEASGFGKAVYRDGTSHVGLWEHNKAEGFGFCHTRINDSLVKISGTWHMDQLVGIAKIVFEDGQTQTGCFTGSNFKRQGVCIIENTDGSNFKGYFKNDRMDGKGVMQTNTGRTLECTWKKGKKHGVGKFTSRDGRDTFVCKWKNEKLVGRGVQRGPSGNVATRWKNDVLVSECILD